MGRLEENACALFQGPHDGSKVTTGANDGTMPDTIWLQRQANGDGYQPYSATCVGKFVVKYVRVYWGKIYRYSGIRNA